ncbi:tryptophan halogenase family protein [Algibacillus agarilyticus]|uniref:tryptophan halogenase family protein n=1 Tax=Algibacillus agarilyticus TaxID=2234133 RepID=UPI000DCFBB37|nr:tryptophan halogenase family protein [Algibacillus agarilyticus]
MINKNKIAITIVGGGTAGWLTAAILAKGLDKQKYTITVIESPDIPTIGVGEATIPTIIQLFDYLGLPEADVLSKIEGTYKYGIHFENWSQIGDQYMHAFGQVGTPLENISFMDIWLNFAEELQLNNLNSFSPTAVAAYNNRFSRSAQPKQLQPNCYYPLSVLHYAFQFDAGLLAKILQEFAVEQGAIWVQDTVEQVNLAVKGDIESVKLASGKNNHADIFVDCSGTRGLLNKQALKGHFEEWKSFLPCDTAIAVQTSIDEPVLPYTKSIAMNSGWRWQIPLRKRMGNGYVFSSEFIGADKAELEFMQSLELPTINTPRTIKFQTGCLDKPWDRNSVAIGLSAGFLEPLESTSIHLIYKYAINLKNAFVYGKKVEEEADLFNTEYKQDCLEIRDFLIAHYHLTDREDSAFWRYCKNMSIPDSLNEKLRQFKQTGHIQLKQGSLFAFESWAQLLVGQKYLKSYKQFNNPIKVNGQVVTTEQAHAFLSRVHHAIQQEIIKLPSHTDFIKSGY